MKDLINDYELVDGKCKDCALFNDSDYGDSNCDDLYYWITEEMCFGEYTDGKILKKKIKQEKR